MSEQVLRNKNVENPNAKNRTKIRTMVQIGMLSTISVVLMLFEIPMPFAPSFYKIDLSEVPILIGTFAMGPVAGILMELIKILLNFAINGTITAGVGELANFLIGCALVVPAGMIYRKNRTKKGAMLGLAAGTLCLAIAGGVLNAFVLLPAYAAAFGGMDAIIGMGTAINSNISGINTFVLFAVVPFNLVKGILVSVITVLLYKRIRVLLKGE